MRLTTVILLFVSFLFGCKGTIDVPEPTNTDSVFISEFNIDGDNQTFAAGEDDLHIVPSLDTLNDELIFISTFKPKNCDRPCPGSLTFRIYANQLLDRKLTFNDAISNGNKDYRWLTVRDSQKVILRHQSKGSPERSYFIYNDERVLVNSPAGVSQLIISSINPDEICLEDVHSKKGISKQCHTILPDQSEPPRMAIKVLDSRSGVLEVTTLATSDMRNANFKWSTGDTGKSIVVSPAKLIGNEICVSVSFPNPDKRQSTSCITIENSIDNFDLNSDFVIQNYQALKPLSDKSLGLVEVTYIDDAGDRYSTVLHRQPKSSFFKINNTEDFEDPITGDKLKLAKIAFQAELYSDKGEIKKVSSSESKIALKIP